MKVVPTIRDCTLKGIFQTSVKVAPKLTAIRENSSVSADIWSPAFALFTTAVMLELLTTGTCSGRQIRFDAKYGFWMMTPSPGLPAVLPVATTTRFLSFPH